MDRNSTYVTRLPRCQVVALRKESVDRNDFPVVPAELTTLVALRKESVDRNMLNSGTFRSTHKSLSARRAWIEINLHCVEEVSGDSRSPQGERG